MKLLPIALGAFVLAGPAQAQDSTAFDILSGLTAEVGQRLAGSDREAAARVWAVAKMKALGLQNVREEGFTIPGWERGQEWASLTVPVPQKLAVAALGYSGATPAGGVQAPLVYFASLDALKAAPDGSLAGKVAFVDHAMKATQDGSGYGFYGAARRAGPGIAKAKGATALLIRSIGTDPHRNPHTGVSQLDPANPGIAAAAVSNPDADLIARTAASGKPMQVSLVLTPRSPGTRPSGNVIGEVPGANPKLAPVLVGCHLDSWDLGQGAIDDAAGCAIVTAAALRAAKAGKLQRTVRVLWAGAEEFGGFGGDAYAKAHGAEPHALAMESDFGADRVYKASTNFSDTNKALAGKLLAALAPLGIVPSSDGAHGGTDVAPIIEAQKLPVIDLHQDGTRYFDLHHTPDDTLDKIDPVQLEQNVAAWTAVLRVVGNEMGSLSGAN